MPPETSGSLWALTCVASGSPPTTFRRKRSTATSGVVVEGAGGGVRTLVLTYRQMRCVSRNDDGTQQLSLPLVCALWPWDTQSFTFSVTLPREFDAEPAYLSGYFADAMVVEEEISGQTIRCSVPAGLLNRESVTMEMTLPRGYFLLFNLPGRHRTFDLILISLLSALGLFYWLFTLRNPFPRRRARQIPSRRRFRLGIPLRRQRRAAGLQPASHGVGLSRLSLRLRGREPARLSPPAHPHGKRAPPL